MPLDPQAAAALEFFASAGEVRFEDMTPRESRLTAWGLPSLGAETKEEVAGIEHRFLPGPTADLPVWIYYPHGKGPHAAVVFFHGGGFTNSNLEIYDTILRTFVNRTGCAFVAVNYQKAPEHKFPIPLDDCYAGLVWTAEHAEELGIDPTRIGVAGDSAGGTLAAAVCIKARDEDGPPIRHQMLLCATTDYGWDKPSAIEFGQGYLPNREALKWLWESYVTSPDEADNPLVSPLRAADLSDLPPAYVVTAECDPCRDDGELYAERLQEAGVPVTLSRYDGMLHGFTIMSRFIDRAHDLHDEIGAEVRRALQP